MSSETVLPLVEELPEQVGEPEDDRPSEGQIIEPFDPTKIRVETQTKTIDNLVARMEHGEIILQPDFQRLEVWRDTARSRLIESILIRIPLPAFYMDATEDDRWIVIDGQQRLSTIRKFVIENSLHLTNLEFLTELEGKTFDQIPQSLRRRIRETNVTVYLVEQGTPPKVKFNIFKRINTGGLPLSPQEIRHALNQGKATELLATLAQNRAFLSATMLGVSSSRMADREMVLRFLAFVLHDPATYSVREFDTFLSDVMVQLNETSDADLDGLTRQFEIAMERSELLLGQYAFRKQAPYGRRQPINKALFEAWSVNLGKIDEDTMSCLFHRKDTLLRRWTSLVREDKFRDAVSQGTGDASKVQLRFERVKLIILETLGDPE